jgi:hypothetical protein
MRFTRKALLVAAVLALLASLWVWWSRPVRVDMAAYVPADAVVYLEANSLPEIAEALTSAEAWRKSGAQGGAKGWDWAGRLGRFAALTGVGSGEAVMLARAQVAVVVLGFKAAEESETSITFAPRVAVVAETHTGDWRARAAVEKLVGDFARRSFGEPQVERKELDGVPAVVWAEATGSRRRIVAAVRDGVAVAGNDETVVRACLDVRRGARQSLAGSAQLAEMRERLDAGGALAFGFAPQGSAAKVVEVLAPAFVGSATEEPRVQSMMATLLPKLTEQLVKGVGWSARAAGGRIEDRYLLALPEGMSERLRGPLATAESPPHAAAGLLPPDTYQTTIYHFRNPEFALRGVKAALSSQVDVASAAFISWLLQSSLKSYGVEEPSDFLRGVGAEIVTARLSEADEEKVFIVEVLDREALRAQLGKQRGARPEQLDGAELFVPADPEEAAAAFVGNHLVLGPAGLVRRCLAARQEGRTLKEAAAYKGLAGGSPPLAQSLTDERESAAAVVASLSGRGGAPAARPPGELYSVTETRLSDTGIERKTISAFGQFGELVTRLGRGR